MKAGLYVFIHPSKRHGLYGQVVYAEPYEHLNCKTELEPEEFFGAYEAGFDVWTLDGFLGTNPPVFSYHRQDLWQKYLRPATQQDLIKEKLSRAVERLEL